ncbi:MAG: polyprenol phosphomannose-dependent alpha 1,6 mannosyltransferase MptB, partial [Gordonia sp. (in: high G+C Gram-positive bacteria)]|uniref:polyprenol phosphomannose-dependent alpha 1,6 mannosyltransferase MptB n=1 Tax=Gordonia sp. (in: high G+C Gram-positive bacteria) TaxID=84139 RepID=UPI003BB80A81
MRRWYPDSVLGFVGALLLTVGTYGLADIPRNDDTLADLGLSPLSYGHGKSIAWILFWAGAALMVIAWVRIGRALNNRTCGLDLRGVRWTVAAWVAPMVLAIPVFSRDVYAYLGQARVLAEGFNPYYDGPAHAPGPIVDSMAQIWAPTTSPYSPGFLLIVRGVVGVAGENVWLGVFLIRLILLIGLGLCVWALPVLAKRFGASQRMSLWLVLLNPMLLGHLVGGAHLELLMMGLLAAGMALAVTTRPAAGLLFLGLAASIKITAAIAIPFVFWIWLDQRRQSKTLTPADRTGIFVATAAIPAAVFGFFTVLLGLGVGWINGLSWASRIINPFTIPTLVGHIVTYVAAPWQVWNLQEVLPVTRAIGQLILVILLVWLWWRFRADSRAALAGAAWAMLTLLLLEPSTLPWYYVWTLVLAIAFDLPLWVRQLVVGISVYFLIVFQPDDSIVFYKPVESLIALA